MSETSGTATHDTPARHFLTFRLDDRAYAIPAEDVSEVIRIPLVARMPQSPKSLMGLANLRGAILPVASGRNLLGQEDAPFSAAARAIVLTGTSPVALAVDSISALVELAAADVEMREAELAALPGEMLQGAFQLEKSGAVIKLLNVPALLRGAFVVRQRQQRKTISTIEGFQRHDQTQQGAHTKMVGFAVADQEYALSLEIVQEIVTAPSLLATVPHSETLVLGVAMLRNSLLPLLSLRGLLGF